MLFKNFPFLIRKFLIFFLISSIFFSIGAIADSSANDSTLKFQTIIDGKLVDARLIGPGLPPPLWVFNTNLPDLTLESTKTLDPAVPTMTWSYGCAATSATMYYGYNDRNGYPDMYVGPTNGGIFPLTNAVWGSSSEGNGQCPLTASQKDLDNRTTYGHKDDYYYAYGSSTDPYYNNWTEHTPQDCIGDFMGTNQYINNQSTDGGTWFWNYNDGSPYFDPPDNKTQGKRDGIHGMKLFAESRGYSVTTNYNQYIYGYNGNTKGFAYDQYKAEIDAGYPVLIQVKGHTMLGVGYSGTDQVILHDTWDYSSHTMTWGGYYADMQHIGVGVLNLVPITITYNITATAGTGGSISPSGNVTVPSGSNQTFTITASSGYSILDVQVDGNSVGAVSSYTFTNVTSNHTISATFSPNPITYIIVSSAGTGGSISPSGNVTVPSGSNQSFSITASGGYSISDVLVDSSSVGAVSSYTFTNVTSDHTISATFSPNPVTYIIVASAGTGGSISPSGNVTVLSGSNQSFSITASGGYSISDVLVDSSSVGAVSSYTFTNVTSDHTISATFSPNPVTYIIVASAGTGGSISPSGNVTVPSGSNQSFSITASGGYSISDVLVDSSSVGAVSSYTFTNVTSDHTISATFSPNPVTYTIFASAGTGGSISPSGNVTVPSGSNQSFSIAASGGYSISDVLVDSSSVGAVSSYTFTNVTSDHTISATFSPNPITYTIFAIAGAGGNISPSCNVTVPSGSNQSFSITASGGYSISDVLVDSSSVGAVSSYTFTNVTSDHTISATFSPNPITYIIVASAGTGGSISPSGNVTVLSGSNQSFSITASGGYSISDVLVDSSSVGAVSSYTFTNVTSDHTISATFSPNPVTYIIVASAGTGGSISPSGNVTVPSGSNQSFSITASGGYSISDVLVDSSSVGAVSSYTFTNVTSDHTISATFSPNPVTYIIVASAGTGGSISPSGNVTVPSGSNQSFSIAASGGYSISDVLVDSSSVGAVSSYTFTNVTSDHTISATFRPISVNYTIFASAGTGGSISPSGNVTVPSGSNQSFSITASGGYSISDVLVDSISVGAVSSYTFTNVTSNHMISASFRKIGGIHEINATADAYTIVYPRGIISYPEGSNKTYLTQSKPGSDLTDVLVDNESKGSIESWSFTNISSDHNILTTGGYTPGQVHVFFAVNQTGGQAPLAVQFTDKSVGNPMSWYWQFGDGDTSVSQNPLHLYQVPGVYSVTLRAVNNQSGGVCVWNNAIIVTD